MSTKDLFKEAFKYYKRKVPRPDYNQVIDFDLKVGQKLVEIQQPATNSNPCSLCNKLGLRDHKSWSIHSLSGSEGFLHLKNPFTTAGQQMWIRKCYESYPRKPSITNLDRHYSNVDDIWSLRNSSNDEERKYLSKLCWATLGYNYDWDDKRYYPERKSHFPECLKQLSQHIASCLGYKDYEPQSAIINYYNMKSTLGIHVDNIEEHLDAPILSFSFGQTGIFLIGTENKMDEPSAMFLRSGDVVVMSGTTRSAYHAIPKILSEDTVGRYSDSHDNEWIAFENYLSQARINISVRQVYKTEER